jgi:hypothetical protein
MPVYYRRPIITVLIALMTFAALSGVGEAQRPRAPLPLEPGGKVGEVVWPAFEGWFRNDDGSFTLLLGYFNRNQEPVEVPIGDDNRIEPGGPDRGQPTVFESGRGWGVFSINVPADFGNQKLTWTLVVNGQTAQVSFWLNPPYFVEPLLNRANGNTPPLLTLGGDTLQGPPSGSPGGSKTVTTRVGEPLELSASVADSALAFPAPGGAGRRDAAGRVVLSGGRRVAPLSLTWRKYRGPGDVSFTNVTADVTEAPTVRLEFEDLQGGEAVSTAIFGAPGEYRLMVTVNDISGHGGGGDQCCWTTGYLDVTVK